MIKKIFLALALLSLSTAYAGNKNNHHLKPDGSWNRIEIYNNTGQAIAYVMMGVYGGAQYGIAAGGTDTYHSGIGDQYATFNVAACGKVDRDACLNVTSQLKSCTDGHYNADLIRRIDVNSLSSCAVICNDGSTTSCKQSG